MNFTLANLIRGTAGTALIMASLVACKKPAINLDELLPSDDTPSLTITAVTPNNQKLNSGTSNTYTVTASGDGLVFSWKLNGSEDATHLPFATTSATFLPDATMRGNHVISLDVMDSHGQSQSLSWNVAVDQLQVSKVTADNLKFTTDYSTEYIASASTTNGSPLSYTWHLDGAASAYLSGASATITFGTTSGLIGGHTISVNISDGELSSTLSWPVEVNALSQGCNTQSVGSMCAVAGLVNIGDGFDVATKADLIHTNPRHSTSDELGNLIWSDYAQNYVWYWNRSAATVSRFGKSILPGTSVVIAGTGANALPASLPALATSIPIGGPSGVAYDSINGKLFVGAVFSNRVYAIDATTSLTSALLTGATTNHSGTALVQGCGQPSDLAVDTNFLYVACSAAGSTTARVKKITLSDLLTTTIVAGGGATYTDGGSATGQLVDMPFGIWVDSDGVFIASGTHYILYVNTSAGVKSFFGGSTTSPGSVRRIIGNGVGSNPTIQQSVLTYPMANPRDIYRNGQSFWISHASTYISVANNTGSSLTIDQQTISNNNIMFVNSGPAGFTGFDIPISQAKYSFVYGLNAIGTSLYVTDNGNSLLREIDLITYETHQGIGSGLNRTSNTVDDSLLTGTEQNLYFPRGLAYDSTSGNLFIADSGHGRVRKLLRDGRLLTVAGTGNSGTSANFNVSPLSAVFNLTGGSFTGMALINNLGLIISHPLDHLLSVWNFSTTSGVFLNRTVPANKLASVAGSDGISGNATSGSIYSTAGLSSPTGLAYKTSTGETFVADSMNHCIKSISATGVISILAGTCGISGNTSGALLSSRFNSPQALLVDNLGNLFVSDYINSRIVYVNLSASTATVLGVAVPSGTMQTVLSMTFPIGIAYVSGNNAICAASYTLHYVKCYSADTGLLVGTAGISAISQPGTTTSGNSTDGTPANTQMLTNPTGLSSDDNFVYISDYGNGIIHRWRMN